MIVNTFSDGNIEMPDDDVVAILKGIYGDRLYAEYAGGSLTYDHKGKLLIFNVGQCKSPHVDYWVAKLYLKWKTEGHFYFKKATEIVQKYRRWISGSGKEKMSEV